MAFAAAYAVLFLCTHGSMLPEMRTEYYEQKAKAEADSATGAEAELMALPAGLALVKKNRRIPLLIATALLAGCVIGLEFMLDRSNINDWLLYIVYILCIAGYIFVGLKWANRACEQAENNV